MLINRRNALMAGGAKLSAKSYVQDGLVVMWDGIENAGWEVDDPNATTWKDLTGNGYDLMSAPANGWVDGGRNVKSAATNPAIAFSDNDIVSLSVCSSCIFEGSNDFISITNNRKLYYYNNKKCFICMSSTSWGPNLGLGVVPQSITIVFNFDHPPGDSYYYRNMAWYGDSAVQNYTREWVGSHTTSIGCPSYQKCSGVIHNVRIYSRALTADEIAANYAVDKARFNLPDAT